MPFLLHFGHTGRLGFAVLLWVSVLMICSSQVVGGTDIVSPLYGLASTVIFMPVMVYLLGFWYDSGSQTRKSPTGE